MGTLQKVGRMTQKGIHIIGSRLREQGLGTMVLWIFNRGFSYLTGVPILRRSRITPRLYVGPQFNQRGLALLQDADINAVINMRIEFDDAEEGLLLEEYCHLPTVDDEAPSLDHIDEGVRFIRRITAEGGKVYIHCAGGIGRAPTMAAAYLIAEGATLDEALDQIKRVRPYIRIMPPQIDLLREVEKRQRERMEAALDKGGMIQ